MDVFSGAGGFSLGAEQAGFDLVASVEYDPIHAAAHEYNFPRCKVLCADASVLNEETLRSAIREGVRKHRKARWNGELDLVVGGVPCQGFSAIGKRRSDDPRNLLAFVFLDIVSRLKPRYFLMENVPGMMSFVDPDGDGAGTLLNRLIREFEGASYRVLEPRVLNASFYGVPQDRKRLIVIGCREDQPLAKYPAPTAQPVPKRSRDKPRPGERGKKDTNVALSVGPTVADAIGDLPNVDDFGCLIECDTLKLEAADLQTLEVAASPYVRRLRDLDNDARDYSFPRKWERRELTGLMRTAHRQESIKRFESTNLGEMEVTSRFYRLDPCGLCSTLRAGTGYERGSFMAVRPIHPVHARVITVREAARLHSFPDWFGFHVTKWHGFRQIGNALPPLLGRAVATEIIRALGVSAVKPKTTLELGDRELLTLPTSAAAERYGADLDAVPTHARRWRKREKESAADVAETDGRLDVLAA